MTSALVERKLQETVEVTFRMTMRRRIICFYQDGGFLIYNNDASIEKASIGTDDDGEYCEAESNAEKKENIPDVEACKVRLRVNDGAMLMMVNNGMIMIFRQNASLGRAATSGASTKQPTLVFSWQGLHPIPIRELFKTLLELTRMTDLKSIVR